MNFKQKLKRSRFWISLLFFAGYAAYAVYAVMYYRTFRNALSIVLLTLIAATFVLTATVTFVSYRINLKDAPRPKLHRFLKMAKYAVQLLASGISVVLVLSAVHNTNVFSLIVAVISVPSLLLGLFINILAEYFERKFGGRFGKRVFVPSVPTDENGNALDMDKIISEADGLRAAKAKARKRFGE